jgi:4-hydroxy-3-methylbut-2-enyl diphosphate reductase
MSELAIIVALRVERAALRAHTGDLPVIRTGVGPERVERNAEAISAHPGWISAGLCGGLAPQALPGHVVVADSVTVGDRQIEVPGARDLAARLRAAELDVHVGPVVASDHVVRGRERRQLAKAGFLAVDMESGALAELADDKPFAVVRVVLDTPGRPLLRPGTPVRAWRALRNLRRTGPMLERWSRAITVSEPENPTGEVT